MATYDECCAQEEMPADNDLRELLVGRLHEAENRCEIADRDRELYGRVADACQSALSQLDRNLPQPCSPPKEYR